MKNYIDTFFQKKIDAPRKSFLEYNVITGHGDKNSKVDIVIRLINKKFELAEFVIYADPHDVFIYSDGRFDSLIEKKKSEIELIEKIKRCNVKYKREDKLLRINRKPTK